MIENTPSELQSRRRQMQLRFEVEVWIVAEEILSVINQECRHSTKNNPLNKCHTH